MSLFGGSSQQNNQPAGGGGLFGSSTTQNTGGGGLFGSSTNATTNNTTNAGTGGGLFGGTTNQASTGGGLFGSSTNQQAGATGGGLFGTNTAQQNKPAGGLFGSSTNQNTTGGGGLFGGSTNQQQQTTGGGLFGTSTTQQNNAGAAAGSSLFGAKSNTGTGGGLFGQQNAAGAAGASTSLFGAASQQPQQQQSTLFGGSTSQAQQQQPQQAHSISVFAQPTVSVGNMGHTMTQTQLQRLQLAGVNPTPNEKSVAEQVRTVNAKWNPESESTILKTYLYNAVPKEYAPFFYPNTAAGEDERSWEEALSQKPEPPKVDGKDVDNVAYVPILVKGFKALGDRAQTQATIVQQMRARLHEMNNSLTAIMDAHEQRITANIVKAKRQHQVLQQKCLRLAVKVQVLRNRGYALDGAEEGLRKTLINLDKQVSDPSFVGREEEIWARMIALKEKARWLEEEGKWVNSQVQQQQQTNSSSSTAVPEHVLAKTRKILKDYDGQLQHLNRELEDVKKEYADWEQSRR